MLRLVALLCAGLFLTLLIGGRDAGQTRLGLAGAYDIAALEEAPAAAVPSVAAEVAAPVPDAAPQAAAPVSAPAAQVTQAAFGTPGATDAGDPGPAGRSLALPLVSGTAQATAGQDAVATVRVGRILGSTVNVRAEPSARAAVLDRLARDETVTVISSDGTGWSLVRIEGDGVEGYVASRYLADVGDSSGLFPSE